MVWCVVWRVVRIVCEYPHTIYENQFLRGARPRHTPHHIGVARGLRGQHVPFLNRSTIHQCLDQTSQLGDLLRLGGNGALEVRQGAVVAHNEVSDMDAVS